MKCPLRANKAGKFYVKIAKNVNNPKLLDKMTLNDATIDQNNLPDAFAPFFNAKVRVTVTKQNINDMVNNGHRKIWTKNQHFMSFNNILEPVKILKSKICEGHGRSRQRILKD